MRRLPLTPHPPEEIVTVQPIAALPTATDEASWAGANWPLGAHYDAAASATTFTVAAPDATRVRLEVYARATGAEPVTLVSSFCSLPNKSSR